MKKFVSCLMVVFIWTIWLKMDNQEYARYDKHCFASKHHIRVPQIKIVDNGVYFCRSNKCEDKDSWDGYIPDDFYIIIENDNRTTYWPKK